MGGEEVGVGVTNSKAPGPGFRLGPIEPAVQGALPLPLWRATGEGIDQFQVHDAGGVYLHVAAWSPGR